MSSMTKPVSAVTVGGLRLDGVDAAWPVTAGIDTHGQVHHVAVIDARGRAVDDRPFPATVAGYRQLVAWLDRFGPVEAIGIEGTGCYGAALAAHLRAHGGG